MKEVLSPINLKDIEDARIWSEEVMVKRPYRTQFFDVISTKLQSLNIQSVIELGSGPGYLAEKVLSNCSLSKYVLFDFSEAMHHIAKHRLEKHDSKCQFVTGDFRREGWVANLGKFDSVITMQAAHEVRHKNRAIPFLSSAKTLLNTKGVMLYCDHFFGGSEGMKDNNLYMSTCEQQEAFVKSGFNRVELLLTYGSLNLWLAQ